MVQDSSFFQGLTRNLMRVLVALVISLAVVFSLARLLLPSVDSYRHQVEALASELIGLPVRIEAMDARLLGLDPTIILKGVQLMDEQAHNSLARFSEAHVTLNLIETLRLQQPTIAELGVVGMDLTIERQTDGSIAIQGLPVKERATGAETGESELTSWLMAQGHLSLRESRVTWRDLGRKGRSWSFDSVNIELQNSADRHQLNAEIVLPHGMGNSLGLYADLRGDITKPRGWQGRFYLEAGGVHPAPWLGEIEVAGVQYQKGTVDINLWAEWADAELQTVTGELALTDLSLNRDNQASLKLDRLASTLAWTRQAKGWRLRLADAYLEQGGRGWEPAQIELSRQEGRNQILASYLRLDELSNVLQVLPVLEPEQLAMLKAMAPRGVVRGLRAEQSAEGAWQVQTGVERVGLKAWQSIPGIQGFSGKAIWQGRSAYFKLDSTAASLDMPRLFRAPLALQQLQGEVWLGQHGDEWTLSIPQGHVANSDLSLDLAMEMRLPAQGKPFLELYGRYQQGRAASAPRYYPAHIMHPNAVAWLDQAFVDGQVSAGGVVVHGQLADFPFEQGQGRFEVGFDASEVELAFLEGWPPFTELDARVVFLGAGLDIQAHKGKLFNAELGNTRVRIPELKRALLEVDGRATLLDQDVLRLLTDTPLVEPLGRYLGDMRHSGETQLQLKISAPLSHKIDDRSLQVDGKLAMRDSRLRVHKGLTFEDMEGELRFDEQGLASDRIEAQLFGHPVTATIETRDEQGQRQTTIAGRGGFMGAALSSFFDHPIAQRIRGDAAWEGRLIIGHHRDGKRDTLGTSLQIDSDLVGMTVDLPTPLGKPAERQRYMVLTHHFSGPQQGLTHFRYGLQADVLLQLQAREGRLHLQRGNVYFGKSDAVLPEADVLKISGQLREVELKAWGELVRGQGRGQSAFLEIPLLIEMEQLHLSLAEAGQAKPAASGEALSLESMPTLRVRIKQFGFNETALERLEFNTRSVGETFLLEDFLLTGAALQLTGQGRSARSTQRPMTQLKLQLKSTDLGTMFKKLGYKSVISRGETQVNATFNWPGNLLQFDVAQLGGEMQVDVKEGRIEEVDPGAGGRLLGLLSIQALPRRLLLDFGDMFESGFSFDSIKGDVRFKKGEAFTTNTTLKSPSAKVIVSGRTGLVAEDFDQVIDVIPNVSDTVPLAGALAWGPQVGAALLLFKKLLFSGLDEAAKFQYTITGSWEKPLIKRVVQATPEEDEAPLYE